MTNLLDEKEISERKSQESVKFRIILIAIARRPCRGIRIGKRRNSVSLVDFR